MRRLFCFCMIGLMMMASCAMAEDPMMRATNAIFDAIQEKTAGKNAAAPMILQTGSWLSAVAEISGVPFTEWAAVTYDVDAGTMVTWDDLFTDGDAAAARIEEIAQAATYDNAYSERNEIAPAPRDNFIVDGAQLTIYYPPTQLSYFSDRAGAFSFYAYELDGLLREEVPLVSGDAVEFEDAMDAILRDGILSGLPGVVALGVPMADAAEALVLVDVPDIKNEAAVWLFEDPGMRGVALLSARDDINVDSATVTGILAERIDLQGMCAGLTAQDECLALMGAASRVEQVAADAYGLLPAGETHIWAANGHELGLHFVDGVLHSVLLCIA